MPTLVSTFKFDFDPDEIIEKKGLAPYGSAQKAVDEECIRLVQPYVPSYTGILSGAFSETKIGSGRIIQKTPYARYLYYGELYVDPNTGSSWAKKGTQKVPTGRNLKYDTRMHPMAGARWFDRMKADHIQDIINVAKENIK